jgi:zinc protease
MMSVPLALFAALAPLATPTLPSIPAEVFTLPNGLRVILSEDHTAPVVGIDILYNVGSKDERPGRTGFAHLFEHLMFEGSEHVPKGEADRLIEAAGGNANGGTRSDSTEYWEQVPSNALEQMLFIESDRMGFLLPTLVQAKLDNQRDVVRNERRQSYEMRPYGLAPITLAANLWDPEFPYHWLPIGSHEDLEAASLEDVRDFFQRYYNPRNATLAIAGDFDPKKTRALVAKWFGALPGGSPPARTYPAPKPLTEEKRVALEDDVQLPRIYVAWQSPKVYAPGDAALDVLGQILTDGKSARLVKRLVMDERIAQGVEASQQSEILAGTFMIVATPKPEQSLDRIRKEIDEEVARLAQEPPSEVELARAKTKIESNMIFALEPVGGFGGRAAALNSYQLLAGDPLFFPKDLERYRQVTAADVQQAAATWLRPDARVILTVMPRAKTPAPAKSGAAQPSGSAHPARPAHQKTEGNK